MSSGALRRALVPHPVDRLPASLRGGVAALGNFDGMHGGHRALVAAALAAARARACPALVVTFEPHPRTVLRPREPVFRLTPLPAKGRLLAALGVDGLVVVPFDRAFAANPPETFVADYLVARLAVAGVVVGGDFRFGQGRAGTVATLRQAGDRAGFSVVVLDEVRDAGGAAFASSAVRQALAAGDVAAANRQLGYRWFVVGEVVRGAARGRDLGFPTANLVLAGDCGLRHGIYAVRVERADGSLHDAVASFGRRPTFDNGAPLLEIHLLDFAGDLYGEALTVSFVDWLRPEEKFESVDALVAAIARDVAEARRRLAAAGPGTGLDRALAEVV